VFESLTARERDAVRGITSGTPLKIIAFDLSISVQAVSTYLLRAQRKLGAKSRSELVTICAVSRPRSTSLEALARPALTSAEVDVGNAIVAGEPYSSIAKARGTSPRTIQYQARAVLRKCGGVSRFELAALVRGDGGDRTARRNSADRSGRARMRSSASSWSDDEPQ